VAQISLLRLLKQLPAGAEAAVRCVTFACPAVGNPALAHYIKEAGWEGYFQNLLIPGLFPYGSPPHTCTLT